ncbi:MAG: hypothetical protein PHQ98_03470 [Candidatus ainarchaeum sp.]|nr:hypothetical protein [Candidatus ainarchaeum sp.]
MIRKSSLLKENHFFSSEKNALYFVYLEVIYVFVLTLISILQINIFLATNQFDLTGFAILIIGIFYFILIYRFVSMKDHTVIKLHKNFSKVVFGKGKEKFLGMNRQIIVLYLVEILIAIFIAGSIFVYLDPDFNIAPWPFNYVAFIGILAFGFYIFSLTKPYSNEVYGEAYLKSKLIYGKRLIETKKYLLPSKKSIIVTTRNKKRTRDD